MSKAVAVEEYNEADEAYEKALTSYAIAVEALEESWGEAEGMELMAAEEALNQAWDKAHKAYLAAGRALRIV